MAKISPANPIPYIIQRQNGDLCNIKSRFFDERLRVAKNLFKRDLVCHYGCVNAIEFSDNGEFLVSGGDDRRVVLWKFGETLVGHGQPEQMISQHLSNIFCLAITPDNSRIYSGGNDDQVIVHDTNTKRVVELLPHQKAVCGLSIDPFNPRILATAGNDGRLLVFDTRQSVDESVVVCRSRKAFHAVVFHPLQAGLMAAASAQDGASLWDLRKAKRQVMKYGGTAGLMQNCMSVRFDTLGSRVLALRRRLPPALYSVQRPEPLAYFYHPDYYNSCTMKSCCFAGDRDQFVLSGSDDFNLYMWRVPDGEINEAECWVNQTHMVLYGHRSIVNQVRYNPQYSVIASSGVEKIIKTWSPVEIPGSRGALLEEQAGNDNPRTVYSHEEYVSLVYNSGQYISHNYTDQSTSEDPRMMAFFDSLVQREIEGWSAEESDSQSGVDSMVMGLGGGGGGGGGGSGTRGGVAGGSGLGVTTRRQAALSSSAQHSRRGSNRKESEDSTDSDQLLVDFLPLPPKRVTNGLRNQRCHRMATRQSKLLRLTQKRSGPGTRQNTKLAHASTSSVSPALRARIPRSLPRRASGRAPAPSAPQVHTPPSVHSSSEAESDSPPPLPPPRPHHRNSSKMSRSNRRRMNMPRSYDRKNKSNSYRGKGKSSLRKGNGSLSNGLNSSHLFNSNYSEDSLAVPSTSTGIRGTHSTPLFRIAEVDSDDDQSGGSRSTSVTTRPTDPANLPLVSILPTPINGTHDDLKLNMRRSNNDRYSHDSSLARFGDENDSQQSNLPDWGRSDRSSSTLARLRNETNESEVESSCSTASTVEEMSSPAKRRITQIEAATPDSGIHTGPSSSSGRRGSTRTANRDNQDCSDEPDWVVTKHRQRVKRARRNYRTHIGDSDST